MIDDLKTFRMTERLRRYPTRRAQLLAGIEFQRFKYRVVRDAEQRADALFFRTKGDMNHHAIVSMRRYCEQLHKARLVAYSDGRRLLRELEIVEQQAAEAREVLGLIELEAV